MLATKPRVPRNDALALALALSADLEPYCEAVQVAGSLRREAPTVGDIELLVIPRLQAGIIDMLDLHLRELITEGVLAYRPTARAARTYGPLNKLLVHVETGIHLDIFSTSPDAWFTALVVRTGSANTNKAIATAAIKMGYRFMAYGVGFETPHGIIQCRSEREVFETVKLPYLEPGERN